MNRIRSLAKMTILIALAFSLQGCIGFSGPNGIRKEIAKSQNIELEKEFGVDVGPLGFALANVVAAPFVPVTADGMWSASFGEYHIRSTSHCTLDEFNLDAVPFDDWVQFIRVRNEGENIRIMHNAKGKKINKLLVLIQENNMLQIARLEGDFEKIIDNFLDSELFDEIMNDIKLDPDVDYCPEDPEDVQLAAADVEKVASPRISALGAW